MYYHPFSSSNQLQYHHPYSQKPKSIAIPYRPHPNLYHSFSNYNNQGISYIPYYNVHHPKRQGPKRVQVWLWGITCIQAGLGELGYLQIYGTLGANNTILWSKEWSKKVNIHEGQYYPISVTKEIVLEEGQPLKLHGHLWEFDTLPPNDDMGEREIHISYYDLKKDWVEYKLKFQESDQIVEAVFQVRMI